MGGNKYDEAPVANAAAAAPALEKPKTPESIIEHAEKYLDGAWRNYSLTELGTWVHNLVKRAGHRTDPAKKAKDLADAQNYLNMMQAHIDFAKQ